MLRVDAPTVGLAWAKAAGLSSHTAGDRLRPDQPMRVASNTKTFVAAAILLLSEDGALTLNTSIAALIRPSSVATLIRGGYDPHRITVRMLLQHTSGLFDFASTPSYVGRIMSAPNHRWTRAEQMELAMTSGAPFGEPGAVYRYSDTGYLLLGEILETATRRPMPSAVRTLLSFSTRGLGHTWFESLEPVPAGSLERAHQYIDSVDTYTFDPSMDLWGGGGLVSTLHDLSQFYRMLLRGEIFRQRTTLSTMLRASPQSLAAGRDVYGMGIARLEYDGLVCYGHGGYWGTLVRHCPSIDLTVSAAITNTSGAETLVAIVARTVQRAHKVLRP